MPNGISEIVSPIVAVSAITTSAKLALARVLVCSSAIASIWINVSKFIFMNSCWKTSEINPFSSISLDESGIILVILRFELAIGIIISVGD